jgi:hypothetical protein
MLETAENAKLTKGVTMKTACSYAEMIRAVYGCFGQRPSISEGLMFPVNLKRQKEVGIR